MDDKDCQEQLTPMELQVLSLVATGCKDKEVAKQLNIGVRTVQWHLGHIYQKLNICNRTQAVRVATQKGWV